MDSRRALYCILLTTFCLTLPCAAQSPGSAPLTDVIYLGNGRVLQAEAPRQLSLDAHIFQFEYQPSGLEIAYMGVQQAGNAITQSIRMVGVRRGETTTLFSETDHVGANGKPIESHAHAISQLGGWSHDGRFLLIHQTQFVPAPADAVGFGFVTTFVCLNFGTNPVHTATAPLPDPASKPGFTDVDTAYWWSPDRTRILFVAQGLHKAADGKRTVANAFCTIYDPATGHLSTIPVGDGEIALGWLDAGHVLLRHRIEKQTEYVSHDIATGQDTPTVRPAKMPSSLDDVKEKSAASPTAPSFMLDTERHRIVDDQMVAAVDSQALWVRRTQGPKSVSAVCVGLVPGLTDPQAVWSPNGTQVAYLSRGDLFVTDLTVRSATPREKLAAGETLTCQEANQLAKVYLKQIGLAILQYTQDYNEQMPSADNLTDKLSPYLTGTDFYRFGSAQFIYHAPAHSGLAQIASPASTVLGTYDTRCEHIVLYVDGHVKEFPKQGNAPATE